LTLVIFLVGLSLSLTLLMIYPQKTSHSEVIRPIPTPTPIPTPKTLSTAPKMPLDWTPESARKWVRGQAVSRYGFEGWKCIDFIVFHESRWRHKADNPISTAYGLFQILDTNPAHGVPTQWKRFKKYLNHRFEGDPCKAKYARQTIGTY
jgi:hypothetical protein